MKMLPLYATSRYGDTKPEPSCGCRMFPTAIFQACQYISTSFSWPSQKGAGRIFCACAKVFGCTVSGFMVRYGFSETKMFFT